MGLMLMLLVWGVSERVSDWMYSKRPPSPESQFLSKMRGL